MHSFFQTAPPFRYLKPLVLVSTERDESHIPRRRFRELRTALGATPRHENYARCCVSVFLCGSDLRCRFRLFASITFDHELKVGRVSLFLQLAPQTGPFCVTEQNRDVLWSEIFRVVTTQNKHGVFCGQEQKRVVSWSGFFFWGGCGLSEQKRGILWSGIFWVGKFCGQE